MAVDAYSREFENLARYATEEVSTDAKKQARFRKGLNPKLRCDLHLHHCDTFQALVNKAINAETAQLTYEESRKHTRAWDLPPVLALRSAGFGFQTPLFLPDIHQGHPMWCLT